MIDKFVEQQKEMYEQKREMDMLKETNRNLMQKLETRQGQLDALKKNDDAKRTLTTPPSWAQVLANGNKHKEGDTLDNGFHQDVGKENEEHFDA